MDFARHCSRTLGLCIHTSYKDCTPNKDLDRVHGGSFRGLILLETHVSSNFYVVDLALPSVP